MERFIKKGDAVILVCAVLLCLLMFSLRAINGEGSVAEVYENGVITYEIDLSSVTQSYKIEINGGELLVENGCISYINARCKDKLCEKCGKLKRAGDTAACVPSGTVVTVTGKKTNDKFDVMTY